MAKWETDQMRAELQRVTLWLYNLGHEDDEETARNATLAQSAITAYRIRVQDLELRLRTFHAERLAAPKSGTSIPTEGT